MMMMFSYCVWPPNLSRYLAAFILTFKIKGPWSVMDSIPHRTSPSERLCAFFTQWSRLSSGSNDGCANLRSHQRKALTHYSIERYETAVTTNHPNWRRFLLITVFAHCHYDCNLLKPYRVIYHTRFGILTGAKMSVMFRFYLFLTVSAHNWTTTER
jgi:hypothetical protein